MDADDVPEENAKMTDCYFETRDWRACKNEVRHLSRLHHIHLQIQMLIETLDGNFPRVLETPWERKANRFERFVISTLASISSFRRPGSSNGVQGLTLTYILSLVFGLKRT